MVTRSVVTTERVLASQTTSIVAVGAQVRDELLAAHIGRASQYTVIAPGVEITAPLDRAAARQRLGLQTSGLVVAFVGRLAKVKRPDRFARVAARVACGACTTCTSSSPAMVRGSSDLARGRCFAPLRDRMTLLGWRADVTDVYAACDLVLLTSDNEGMPLSLDRGRGRGSSRGDHRRRQRGRGRRRRTHRRSCARSTSGAGRRRHAALRGHGDRARQMGEAALEMRDGSGSVVEQMVSEMATLYERIAPARAQLTTPSMFHDDGVVAGAGVAERDVGGEPARAGARADRAARERPPCPRRCHAPPVRSASPADACRSRPRWAS